MRNLGMARQTGRDTGALTSLRSHGLQDDDQIRRGNPKGLFAIRLPARTNARTDQAPVMISFSKRGVHSDKLRHIAGHDTGTHHARNPRHFRRRQS
jgi:hypothetical protein